MKKVTKFLAMFVFITAVGCSKEYGYQFNNGFEIGDVPDTLGLTVNRDKSFIDRSKYTSARIFPGLVSDREPLYDSVKVTVDLNYVDIKSSDLRISVAPGNWQSTGMYAPAGHLVRIFVPDGVYGLTAQIGAHVNTSAEGIPAPQRDLEIFNRQVLFPGVNYLRNLYGGLIYILPSAPLGREVDLYFSGIAKAPSFKLGVTDPVEWQQTIQNSGVPWFELEGNRIVFTLETSKAKRFGISDPETVLTLWDKAIKEGYWDWTGLTEGNPDPKHRAPFNKWRIVHDVLFRNTVAQVSGYPVRARNTDAYFNQAVNVEQVKFANWGTYHELGHNMQQNSIWSVSATMGEVTNNLYHFKVSRIFGQQSYKIAEIWNKNIAQSFIGSGLKWTEMQNTYPGHLDIKLIFYAQIFEKYGYEFMTYLSKRARNARFTSANDQSRYDFFYEALCEYTEIDMLPFFTAWGWTISDVSKNYVKNELGLSLLDKKVWLYDPVNNSGGDEFHAEVLSKTGWTITATNYNNDYPATNMLVSDNSKFWNACWGSTGCNVTFSSSVKTWVVTLDLPSVISAKGLLFTQRTSGNNPANNHIKNLRVEISSDGTTWEALSTKELASSFVPQEFYFNSTKSSVLIKQVRITIAAEDLYKTTDYPAIAELGLFN